MYGSHPYYPYSMIGEEQGSAQALDDGTAERVVSVWKAMFPDAQLLPIIGYPSKNKGVLTLTHTGNIIGMPSMPPMTINGVASNSPLANNALYSSEATQYGWLNLYETMLPDAPGQNGAPSLGTRYKNALQSLGIDVAGDHFHWAGGEMMGKFARAIHSQNLGMHPIDFSQRQLQAFMAAFGKH